MKTYLLSVVALLLSLGFLFSCAVTPQQLDQTNAKLDSLKVEAQALKDQFGPNDVRYQKAIDTISTVQAALVAMKAEANSNGTGKTDPFNNALGWAGTALSIFNLITGKTSHDSNVKRIEAIEDVTHPPVTLTKSA